MGGYGVATVGGVVQAGGIIGGIFAALKKAPDRRSLNPIENTCDSLKEYDDNDDNDDDDSNSLNSKPMSRYDTVKATSRFWDSFSIEELITMVNSTPQIVERLEKLKDSLLGY